MLPSSEAETCHKSAPICLQPQYMLIPCFRHDRPEHCASHSREGKTIIKFDKLRPHHVICALTGLLTRLQDRIKEWGKRYLAPMLEWFGIEFPDRVVKVCSLPVTALCFLCLHQVQSLRLKVSIFGCNA